MMQTLSTTIEAKDEYTRGHSYRVAEYAALIAAELGWSSEEIQQLKHAALPSILCRNSHSCTHHRNGRQL